MYLAELFERALDDDNNMARRSLREIIKGRLEVLEYDGLVLADMGCGCHVDDLMPCSTPGEDCEAAHKGEDGWMYAGRKHD